MQVKNLIFLILFIWSCTINNSEADELLNQSIPEIYTLYSSSNITTQNENVFLDGKKYSGYLYGLQANNIDTMFIQSYYDGLQSGVSKKWFDNEQIMEERLYFNGKKHGKQIAFWNNGNKKFEFTAYNDIYEGEMKEWNEAGNLIHLANYKNGQENGTQKLWYDNGKIRANYVIVDGKRFGLLGTKNCTNVSDSIFINR